MFVSKFREFLEEYVPSYVGCKENLLLNIEVEEALVNLETISYKY
jgi:hypothetical protein